MSESEDGKNNRTTRIAKAVTMLRRRALDNKETCRDIKKAKLSRENVRDILQGMQTAREWPAVVDSQRARSATHCEAAPCHVWGLATWQIKDKEKGKAEHRRVH